MGRLSDPICVKEAVMAIRTVSGCASCGYPLSAEFEGQTITCPMCDSINEVIAQGITISTPVFIGILAFLGGMLLGPSIVASTEGGKAWLEKQAKAAVR